MRCTLGLLALLASAHASASGNLVARQRHHTHHRNHGALVPAAAAGAALGLVQQHQLQGVGTSYVAIGTCSLSGETEIDIVPELVSATIKVSAGAAIEGKAVIVKGGVEGSVTLKLSSAIGLSATIAGELEITSECDAEPSGDKDAISPVIKAFLSQLFSSDPSITAIRKLTKAHSVAWKASGEACFLQSDMPAEQKAALSEDELIEQYTLLIADDLAKRETTFFDLLKADKTLAYFDPNQNIDNTAVLDEATLKKHHFALIKHWLTAFLNSAQAGNFQKLLDAYIKDPKTDGVLSDVSCDPILGSSGSSLDVLLCRFVKTLFFTIGADTDKPTGKATISQLVTAFPELYPDLWNSDPRVVNSVLDPVSYRSERLSLLAVCPEKLNEKIESLLSKSVATREGEKFYVKGVKLTGSFSVGLKVEVSSLTIEAKVAVVKEFEWKRASRKDAMTRQDGPSAFLMVSAGASLGDWALEGFMKMTLKPFAKHILNLKICVPCPTYMTPKGTEVGVAAGEVLKNFGLKWTKETQETATPNQKKDAVATGFKNRVKDFLTWFKAPDVVALLKNFVPADKCLLSSLAFDDVWKQIGLAAAGITVNQQFCMELELNKNGEHTMILSGLKKVEVDLKVVKLTAEAGKGLKFSVP